MLDVLMSYILHEHILILLITKVNLFSCLKFLLRLGGFGLLAARVYLILALHYKLKTRPVVALNQHKRQIAQRVQRGRDKAPRIVIYEKVYAVARNHQQHVHFLGHAGFGHEPAEVFAGARLGYGVLGQHPFEQYAHVGHSVLPLVYAQPAVKAAVLFKRKFVERESIVPDPFAREQLAQYERDWPEYHK